MDKLSTEQRSSNMSAIKAKNTKPEMIVRRLAHSLGYRYRLHRKDLPGKPDMVFPSKKAVVFVHGCFWHQHPKNNCPDSRLPKSRLEYWLPKLQGNVLRDEQHQRALTELGWRVLTIWECEVKDLEAVSKRLKSFLEG